MAAHSSSGTVTKCHGAGPRQNQISPWNAKSIRPTLRAGSVNRQEWEHARDPGARQRARARDGNLALTEITRTRREPERSQSSRARDGNPSAAELTRTRR